MLHEPELIIADEPTTALDVTIQAQILAEMQKLCARSNTAMVWVSHDLAVVAGLADRICVMYAGRVVETGDIDTILTHARHPYTIGLLGSVPENVRRGEPLHQIPGIAPSALKLPAGCAFAPRCRHATDICLTQEPTVQGSETHSFRCFHPRDMRAGAQA
jgi:peptide/nickel transport system ATP-binding protein